MALAVLCPTRGRPQNAQRLVDAFKSTRILPDTRLVFGVDDDDPSGGEYLPLRGDGVTVEILPATGRPGMNAALNRMALHWGQSCRDLGFVGDDHLFRSHGWDARVTETLDRVPLVYCDDLLQRQALPTQVFMRSVVVQTLGWMAPPAQAHLYLDNFWLQLGHRVGVEYLPDVVIEHMHPFAGKAPMDTGYQVVNQQGMYDADGQAFRDYMLAGFDEDVARLEAVLP